ncbi:MAG: ABC transporter permease [Planctomycetaceae bacterium]|nr:ABC transporter permease [Planctomycetaceae bacterium]
MTHAVQQLGAGVLTALEHFGRAAVFCTQVGRWMVADLPNLRRWRLALPQLYDVGTRSIPVIIVIGAFIGMMLAVELYEQFRAVGQEAWLGGVIGVSVVGHLGPVMAAMILAGRVGGAFTAELGTMNVTEQIDALRVMAAEPISYLAVPRVVACVIMVPVLTIFSDVLGVFGGWLITVVVHGVNSHDYWAFAASFVTLWDIGVGLVKALFFGLAIGLVSCYKGFHCGRGARGVGRATTEAFVVSFIAIIVLNFFLAKFATDLHALFGASSLRVPMG